MRQDAQRNVRALVDSAAAVFLVSGVDAPAKEITNHAGVGVGTLYRHFPRRSDLIIAVLQHEIDACVAAAETLSTAADPVQAVLDWIDRFMHFVETKRGLAAALHSGDPAYDELPERLLDRLTPALALLLDRARAVGMLGGDATPREVLTTVALLCHAVPGVGADYTRRMARIFVAGLAGAAAGATVA